MRQETDGVLLECYLIYEPEHQATWFKDEQVLLGALDFDEKYQASTGCTVSYWFSSNTYLALGWSLEVALECKQTNLNAHLAS